MTMEEFSDAVETNDVPNFVQIAIKELPKWIKKSTYVQQLEKDFPLEETMIFEDDKVFEFPMKITEKLLGKLFASIQYFGIEDENIHYQLFEHLCKNEEQSREYMIKYPEFSSLWKNVTYIKKHGVNDAIMKQAAENNLLHCLKLGHKFGIGWDESICAAAAQYGNFECLKFAHDNGCPWDLTTSYNAASYGNLSCFQYVIQNQCPWDEITCSRAALCIDCLKFAHENGCPWDQATCANAVLYIENLQYAHSNGCSWDETTCTNSARFGNLTSLKYAHENGCPWDHNTCSAAVRHGNQSCLKYAIDNACPYDLDECLKFAQATWNEHSDIGWHNNLLDNNLENASAEIEHSLLQDVVECIKYVHQHHYHHHQPSAAIKAATTAAVSPSPVLGIFEQPRYYYHSCGDIFFVCVVILGILLFVLKLHHMTTNEITF